MDWGVQARWNEQEKCWIKIIVIAQVLVTCAERRESGRGRTFRVHLPHFSGHLRKKPRASHPSFGRKTLNGHETWKKKKRKNTGQFERLTIMANDEWNWRKLTTGSWPRDTRRTISDLPLVLSRSDIYCTVEAGVAWRAKRKQQSVSRQQKWTSTKRSNQRGIKKCKHTFENRSKNGHGPHIAGRWRRGSNAVKHEGEISLHIKWYYLRVYAIFNMHADKTNTIMKDEKKMRFLDLTGQLIRKTENCVRNMTTLTVMRWCSTYRLALSRQEVARVTAGHSGRDRRQSRQSCVFVVSSPSAWPGEGLGRRTEEPLS